MKLVKGAAELLTGYSSAIKAADDFNDKVGGTDGVVGRAVAAFAQELIYIPLTREAANITSQKFQAASAASGDWEKFGGYFTAGVGAIATAHMGSRVLANAVTLVPNLRERMERDGLI